MYVLIAVHIVSYFIAKVAIGSARYTDPKDREKFPKKFMMLTAVFLVLNGATAVFAVTTVLNNQDEMGKYYKLWIISDVLMLFLAHFNILLEFITTKNMDHVLAEWVYEHIKVKI